MTFVKREENIREEKVVDASDDELELFKKKHGLKTDEEAYNFLKNKLSTILGVIS